MISKLSSTYELLWYQGLDAQIVPHQTTVLDNGDLIALTENPFLLIRVREQTQGITTYILDAFDLIALSSKGNEVMFGGRNFALTQPFWTRI